MENKIFYVCNKKEYYKLTFLAYFVYTLFALHIFILPSDILDKFTFLSQYAEFMKNNFEIVKQISIRTTNFPQSGLLYASNMVVVCVLFFILFVYLSLSSLKINDLDNFAVNNIRKENLFTIFVMAIIGYIFTIYGICKINSGALFDTSLRQLGKSNTINSHFGLFFKAYILYLFIAVFGAGCVVNTFYTIKISYKKFKNLIINFNTKDKK